MRLRRPAVAGTFYPDDPHTLAAQVDAFVAAHEYDGAKPKAIIVPHAGYVYSGPIAGSGYAAIEPLIGVVERVVLLGPAHRVPVEGLAVPSADAFVTPLGVVRVDEEARDAALACDGVIVDDRPHAPEHSLEVHLPFLQRLFGAGVRVLPIVVGHAPAHVIAAVLDALWGGDETLVVVSSDLSHYEDQASARRHDERTAAAVLNGDIDEIGPYDACGAAPMRGLLVAAQHHELDVSLLDLRNSGDTAGPPDRVVGYGAFVFTPRSARRAEARA
jgi:AmmeMemoRadiSam system protein B